MTKAACIVALLSYAFAESSITGKAQGEKTRRFGGGRTLRPRAPSPADFSAATSASVVLSVITPAAICACARSRDPCITHSASSTGTTSPLTIVAPVTQRAGLSPAPLLHPRLVCSGAAGFALCSGAAHSVWLQRAATVSWRRPRGKVVPGSHSNCCAGEKARTQGAGIAEIAQILSERVPRHNRAYAKVGL